MYEQNINLSSVLAVTMLHERKKCCSNFPYAAIAEKESYCPILTRGVNSWVERHTYLSSSELKLKAIRMLLPEELRSILKLVGVRDYIIPESLVKTLSYAEIDIILRVSKEEGIPYPHSLETAVEAYSKPEIWNNVVEPFSSVETRTGYPYDSPGYWRTRLYEKYGLRYHYENPKNVERFMSMGKTAGDALTEGLADLYWDLTVSLKGYDGEALPDRIRGWLADTRSLDNSERLHRALLTRDIEVVTELRESGRVSSVDVITVDPALHSYAELTALRALAEDSVVTNSLLYEGTAICKALSVYESKSEDSILAGLTSLGCANSYYHTALENMGLRTFGASNVRNIHAEITNILAGERTRKACINIEGMFEILVRSGVATLSNTETRMYYGSDLEGYGFATLSKLIDTRPQYLTVGARKALAGLRRSHPSAARLFNEFNIETLGNESVASNEYAFMRDRVDMDSLDILEDMCADELNELASAYASSLRSNKMLEVYEKYVNSCPNSLQEVSNALKVYDSTGVLPYPAKSWENVLNELAGEPGAISVGDLNDAFTRHISAGHSNVAASIASMDYHGKNVSGFLTLAVTTGHTNVIEILADDDAVIDEELLTRILTECHTFYEAYCYLPAIAKLGMISSAVALKCFPLVVNTDSDTFESLVSLCEKPTGTIAIPASAVNCSKMFSLLKSALWESVDLEMALNDAVSNVDTRLATLICEDRRTTVTTNHILNAHEGSNRVLLDIVAKFPLAPREQLLRELDESDDLARIINQHILNEKSYMTYWAVASFSHDDIVDILQSEMVPVSTQECRNYISALLILTDLPYEVISSILFLCSPTQPSWWMDKLLLEATMAGGDSKNVVATTLLSALPLHQLQVIVESGK